jgi:hypothetical protein
MGDNVYAPDDNLTRAQAMTIFSRLLNLVETADISKITDVASDAWYAQWIEKGYAYKIINGTSDTTFDPDGSITREQFFSIFARAMGIPGTDKLAEGKTFTDLDDVSSWFVEEGTVYAMINAGYLNGYPDGSLQPKGNITRAEVAQVLANAIDSKGYITADGTYSLTDMTGIVVVLAKNVTLTGNYTGHIVSSCVDSTLYTTQVNPSSVRAAVNTAADNVKVSNVGVANPPYTPANPYNPSGANYVYVLQDNTNINPANIVPGGGGGGGNPGTTYKVNAIISAPFDKTPIKVSTNITSRNGVTVADAMSALAGAAKNDPGIVYTVNSAFEKIAEKGDQVRHAKGYTITTSATATSASIKVDEGGLEKAMNDISAAYLANNTVAESDTITKAQADAFNALVAVFTPNTLFKNIEDTTMDFLSAEQYRDKVAAAFDAMAAIAESGMTQAQFDALVSRDGYISNFLNNFTYSAMTKDATLLDVTADFDDTTGDKFITGINTVFQANIADYPVLAAIAEAAFHHDGWIQGDYTATVTFDAP